MNKNTLIYSSMSLGIILGVIFLFENPPMIVDLIFIFAVLLHFYFEGNINKEIEAKTRAKYLSIQFGLSIVATTITYLIGTSLLG